MRSGLFDDAATPAPQKTVSSGLFDDPPKPVAPPAGLAGSPPPQGGGSGLFTPEPPPVAAHAGPSPFATMAADYARKHGVDPALFQLLVSSESAYNPRAVSGAGALGLTQLMPGTARQMGVTDPFDPHQNLDGGAKYLRQMLDRYHGNVEEALAAYNAGPGRVIPGRGVPNIKETRAYVSRILAGYVPTRVPSRDRLPASNAAILTPAAQRGPFRDQGLSLLPTATIGPSEDETHPIVFAGKRFAIDPFISMPFTQADFQKAVDAGSTDVVKTRNGKSIPFARAAALVARRTGVSSFPRLTPQRDPLQEAEEGAYTAYGTAGPGQTLGFNRGQKDAQVPRGGAVAELYDKTHYKDGHRITPSERSRDVVNAATESLGAAISPHPQKSYLDASGRMVALPPHSTDADPISGFIAGSILFPANVAAEMQTIGDPTETPVNRIGAATNLLAFAATDSAVHLLKESLPLFRGRILRSLEESKSPVLRRIASAPSREAALKAAKGGLGVGDHQAAAVVDAVASDRPTKWASGDRHPSLNPHLNAPTPALDVPAPDPFVASKPHPLREAVDAAHGDSLTRDVGPLESVDGPDVLGLRREALARQAEAEKAGHDVAAHEAAHDADLLANEIERRGGTADDRDAEALRGLLDVSKNAPVSSESRDAFHASLLDLIKERVLTPGQAHDVGRLWEARANSWASEGANRTADDFYRLHSPRFGFEDAPVHPPAEGTLWRSMDPRDPRLDPYGDFDPNLTNALHHDLFGSAPTGPIEDAAADVRLELERRHAEDSHQTAIDEEVTSRGHVQDVQHIAREAGVLSKPKNPAEVAAAKAEAERIAALPPEEQAKARQQATLEKASKGSNYNPDAFFPVRYTNKGNLVPIFRNPLLTFDLAGVPEGTRLAIYEHALEQGKDRAYVNGREYRAQRSASGKWAKHRTFHISEVMTRDFHPEDVRASGFDHWGKVTIPRQFVASWAEAQLNRISESRARIAAREVNLSDEEFRNVVEYYRALSERDAGGNGEPAPGRGENAESGRGGEGPGERDGSPRLLEQRDVSKPWQRTKKEFLGDSKTTKNANAADLVPRLWDATAAAPSEPFMDGLTIKRGAPDSPGGLFSYAVLDGEKPVASYDGSNLVVDKAYRRRGIATELVRRFRTDHPDVPAAPYRTKAATAVQAAAHRAIVEDALSKGLHVPDEVLRDYPELRNRPDDPKRFASKSVRELEEANADDLDRAAFGVASGEVRDFHPDELSIKWADDLANAEHQRDSHPKGPDAWARSVDRSEPIDVRIQDGKKVVYDGHHRYLAAKTLGETLPGEVTISDNPIQAVYRNALDAGESVHPDAFRDYPHLADRGPRTLEQRGGTLKGKIEFTEGERPVVTLIRGEANVSTVLHESAHAWRRTLPAGDLEILSQHFGDFSTVEAEERFARGIERYLRDGKAPTPELRGVFERFRTWMRALYQKVRNSPLADELHPDVKEAFDRMFSGSSSEPAAPRIPEPAPSRSSAPAGDVVGLANRVQEQDVAAGAYREPEKGHAMTAAETHEAGQSLTTVEEGESLASDIAAGRAPFNGENVGKAQKAALLFRQAIARAGERLDAAIASGDEGAVADAKAAYDGLKERRQTFLDDFQKGKTEWSNAGRALQATSDPITGEFDLLPEREKLDLVEQEARRAKGADLTPKELDAIRTHVARLDALLAEQRAENARLRTTNEAMASAEPVSSGRSRASRPSRVRGRSVDVIRTERAAALSDLRKAAVRLYGGAGAGLPSESVAYVKALGKVAKLALEEGAVSLSDLVARVRGHLDAEGFHVLDAGKTDVPEGKTPLDGTDVDLAARREWAYREGSTPEEKTVYRLHRQLADLERRNAPTEPKAASAAEAESPEILELRERIAKERDRIAGRVPEDAKPELRDAEKLVLRLERELASAVKRIAEGPKPEVQGPEEAAVTELRAKLRQARRDFSAKWGTPPEKRRLDALNRQLERLESVLQNGPKPKTPPVPDAPDVAALKARASDLREKIRAKWGGDSAAVRLQKALDAVNAKIADREAQLSGGYRNLKAPKPPVPDELAAARERLRAANANLRQEDRLSDLEDQIRTGDTSRTTDAQAERKTKAEARRAAMTPEQEKRQRDIDAARAKVRDLIESGKPMGFGRKVAGWARTSALSGLGTFANLTSAVGGNLVVTPFEELMGPVVRQTVGRIGGLGAAADRELRFDPKAELAAIKSQFGVQNFRDKLDIVRGGHGEIENKAIADGLSRPHDANANPLLKLEQATHEAFKTGTKRNAFAREFVKALAEAHRKGLDVQDAAVRLDAWVKAYSASKRALFLNESPATEAIGELKNVKPLGLGNFIRTIAPVTHIPVNIAARQLEYGFGIPIGLARQLLEVGVFRKPLTPELAESIARSYKRGGVGAGLLVLAANLPELDVDEEGRLTWGGHALPAALGHIPAIEAMKMGVYYRKARKSVRGAEVAGFAAASDIANHTPFVDVPRTIVKSAGDFFSSPEKRGDALKKGAGKIAASLIVPQAVQQFARAQDTNPKPKDAGDLLKNMFVHDAKPVPRTTKGFWDQFQYVTPEAYGYRGRRGLPRPERSK